MTAEFLSLFGKNQLWNLIMLFYTFFFLQKQNKKIKCSNFFHAYFFYLAKSDSATGKHFILKPPNKKSSDFSLAFWKNAIKTPIANETNNSAKIMAKSTRVKWITDDIVSLNRILVFIILICSKLLGNICTHKHVFYLM